MNMVDDFPSKTAWCVEMPIQNPELGNRVICREKMEAEESEESKWGTKGREREASLGESCKKILKSESEIATITETESPGVNLMKGLEELEGQRRCPERGRK